MYDVIQTFKDLNAMAAPIAIGLAVLLWLHSRADRSMAQATCLRAARQATQEFYELADRLMKDPATPDQVKHMLYDMTFALTEQKAGKVAFDALLKAMERIEDQGKTMTPPDTMSAELGKLRNHRGDLYDDTLNALRSAIAGLVLSHGSDHKQVEIRATRNSSVLLAISSKIDRVLSDMLDSDNNGKGWRQARA